MNRQTYFNNLKNPPLKRIISLFLIIILAIVVALSIPSLVYLIIDNFLSPPIWIVTVEKLRTIIDLVLWILITIELIETIRAYLEKRTLELETVIAVALIAMARKIIAVRLRDYEATMVLGMAALIAALCLAYYFVRKSNIYPDPNSENVTTNAI